jgi:hypothetical protein
VEQKRGPPPRGQKKKCRRREEQVGVPQEQIGILQE